MRFETADELIKNGYENKFNALAFTKKSLLPDSWSVAFRCRYCMIFDDVKNRKLEAGLIVPNQCPNCKCINKYTIRGFKKEVREVLE